MPAMMDKRPIADIQILLHNVSPQLARSCLEILVTQARLTYKEPADMLETTYFRDLSRFQDAKNQTQGLDQLQRCNARDFLLA